VHCPRRFAQACRSTYASGRGPKHPISYYTTTRDLSEDVRYNASHAIADWQIACVRTTFVPPASTQSDSMPPACPAAEEYIGIVYCPSKMRVALGTARDSQIGPVSSSVKLTGVCVITLATMMWRHVSAQSSRQIATRGSYGSATTRAGNDDLSRSVGTASVIGAWEPQAVCQRR
jgi:hypothetical protein